MSWKQKTVSRYNHGLNNRGKLSFSCEPRHYGKNSVPSFQKLVASIEKSFLLRGKLSTML